jgi:hypothetical protein
MKMLVAGMATAFLSRKPRLQTVSLVGEPRRRELEGDAAWGGDAFLFEPEGASGLDAHVSRHSHAMNGLSELLGNVREIVASVSATAPIIVPPLSAEEPVETDWKAFDEAIFDVVPMRHQAMESGIVLQGGDEDFLFGEQAPIGSIAPVSLIARPDEMSGVRF